MFFKIFVDRKTSFLPLSELAVPVSHPARVNHRTQPFPLASFPSSKTGFHSIFPSWGDRAAQEGWQRKGTAQHETTALLLPPTPRWGEIAGLGAPPSSAASQVSHSTDTREETPHDPEGIAFLRQLDCVRTTTSRNLINYSDAELDFVYRDKSRLTSLPAGYRRMSETQTVPPQAGLLAHVW